MGTSSLKTSESFPTLANQAGALLVAARGSRERKALARSAGITGEALSHIERGTQNPTLNRLEKFGELYGIRFILTAVPLEEATDGQKENE